MSNYVVVAVALLILFVGGCASHSHEIRAADVPEDKYSELECNQIHAKLKTTINKIDELSQVIDEKASGDEGQAAIGMILFWPALFALEGGDGPEGQELAQLKGDFNVLENTAILKNCSDAVRLAELKMQNDKEIREAKIRAEKELESTEGDF